MKSAAEPTAPYEGVSNERTVLDSCRKSARYAELFPLDRRRRLARDVVDDPVDTANFVDDAVRYPGEEAVRQLCPVSGHEVLGFDGTQGDDVLVGAPVAHDPHRLHWQEDGEGLAGLLVPARGAQLVDEYGVGAAQQVGKLGPDFAEDAHPEAGPGNGWR